jgi:hypothetical protein
MNTIPVEKFTLAPCPAHDNSKNRQWVPGIAINHLYMPIVSSCRCIAVRSTFGGLATIPIKVSIPHVLHLCNERVFVVVVF